MTQSHIHTHRIVITLPIIDNQRAEYSFQKPHRNWFEPITIFTRSHPIDSHSICQIDDHRIKRTDKYRMGLNCETGSP